MNNDQALNNLFQAARLAPLNAEQHELIRKCAEQIAEALKPKDEPKGEEHEWHEGHKLEKLRRRI